MSQSAVQDIYNSIDEQGWRCVLQRPVEMSDHALIYLLDRRDAENPQFMRDVFIVPDEAFTEGDYAMEVPEGENIPPAEYFGQVIMALTEQLIQTYQQPEEDLDAIKNTLIGLNLALANFLAHANPEEKTVRKADTYHHYVLDFSQDGLAAHGIQAGIPVIGPDQLSETVHQTIN